MKTPKFITDPIFWKFAAAFILIALFMYFSNKYEIEWAEETEKLFN